MRGAGGATNPLQKSAIFYNGIIGISQGHDVQTNTMIYAALPEFYAILALLGALLPLFLL